MKCFHPIDVINPTKYLSKVYNDRFVIQVRCGHCAACQETNRNEWYYRTYQEFQACVDSGGYVLFDCLTYKPENRPKISRFFDVPKELDFDCFDYQDTTKFMKRLRQAVNRDGYDADGKIRYFYCTEYGTSHLHTHAPHIHLLLFVYDKSIDNYYLSRKIAECWKLGRTDGIPFKSRSYVDNNTLRGGKISTMRVCKYVSKYVTKDSSFQKNLDGRIARILLHIYQTKYERVYLKTFRFENNCADSLESKLDDDAFYSWLDSPSGRKVLRSIRSRINQYHRQSLGYGLTALDCVDLNEIFKHNLLTIQDTKQIVMRIALPTYYKRKLFYEQVIVDGVKLWQLTDLGKQYKKARMNIVRSNLIDELTADKLNYNIDIPDIPALADYMLYKRGRLSNLFSEDVTIEERLALPIIFNYSSQSDIMQYHGRFITETYSGNKLGFEPLVDAIPVNQFIKSNVQFNPEFEKILDTLANKKSSSAASKQRLYDNKQRLNQVYKNLFG